jgi:hypothetical protein
MGPPHPEGQEVQAHYPHGRHMTSGISLRSPPWKEQSMTTLVPTPSVLSDALSERSPNGQ